mmetsp:Transcript_20751/g.45624  ORF Transcript_20751/g.45624 Transcript_20751/m.45624 type:complete len:252 (-) Transcript_20751:910-1665(-)
MHLIPDWLQRALLGPRLATRSRNAMTLPLHLADAVGRIASEIQVPQPGGADQRHGKTLGCALFRRRCWNRGRSQGRSGGRRLWLRLRLRWRLLLQNLLAGSALGRRRFMVSGDADVELCAWKTLEGYGPIETVGKEVLTAEHRLALLVRVSRASIGDSKDQGLPHDPALKLMDLVPDGVQGTPNRGGLARPLCTTIKGRIGDAGTRDIIPDEIKLPETRRLNDRDREPLIVHDISAHVPRSRQGAEQLWRL